MTKCIVFLAGCLMPLLLVGQGGQNLIVGGLFSASHQQSNQQIEVTRSIQISEFPFTQVITSLEEADVTTTRISFSPYVGRIVSPNLLMGLGLDVTVDRSNRTFNGSDSENNRHTLGGRLFLRYTFNPENRLRGYIEPGAGYSVGRGGQFIGGFSSFIPAQKLNEFTFSSNLGATYELSPRLQANFRIGGFYLNAGNWESEDSGEEGNFFTTSFNFRPSSIFFGVEFLL